jgi:hypothetical protein
VDRDTAGEVLGRLHDAQGAFYAGGPDGALRALLRDDVVCWLLPLDPAGFDRIWGRTNVNPVG